MILFNYQRKGEKKMSNNHIKNSIEFLLFSYFNLDLKDASDFDKALDAAIKKAYEDATNEGAYNILFKKEYGDEIIDTLKIKSKNARDKNGKRIKREVKNLLKERLEYDIWHNELCKLINNTYKACLKNAPYDAENWFSYGNSQKWVNMTMKYLYIISGLINELGISDDERWIEIDNIYKQFHVPIDRYIVKSVWNESLKENSINLPNLVFSNTTGKLGKYSSEKYKSWSTWEEEEYNDFRKVLNKKAKIKRISPIEWESIVWIKQAKKERANKNKTTK